MKFKIFGLVLFSAALATLVGFAQTTPVVKIFLNDKAVSSKARMINGVLYAPVDEILKPFDYKSAKKGDRYELTPISGVVQRDGATGSVGVSVKGKTATLKVLGVRPLAGYEEEWLEVYGTITSPVQQTLNLDSAVAVFVGGKQTNHTLSAAEMGGEVYAALNPAESVEVKIQFKREPGAEIERVVLTFGNNKNDIKDVFRIRIKD